MIFAQNFLKEDFNELDVAVYWFRKKRKGIRVIDSIAAGIAGFKDLQEDACSECCVEPAEGGGCCSIQ